ncbi:MAG: glycosyltransferase family 9 protein [Acidobacteriaceae bacterium]|nr:glycosyltransferase family 9 protein [Acidobacteriaceae bacterium]
MTAILVVRLGAMGDVIHTLPAVASLKHSFPHSHLVWAIESKWAPLLAGNPYVDEVIAIDRADFAGLWQTWRRLRRQRFDLAVDFQGLTKSAVVAACAAPERIIGFGDSRESPARWFYSSRVLPPDPIHAVERYLCLAAGAGASSRLITFPVSQGTPEGDLPDGEFVLACPEAGWGSKQWPLDNYAALGRLIARDTGMPLVLNGRRAIATEHTMAHVSSVAGLIHATRRATAVVGLDSGPLHLAAALGKPGVAIFGPTDPVRNGPYQSNLALLRVETAETTYKRGVAPMESMRAISPDMVFEALRPALVATRQRRR